jgi:tetratricopeptide (TPR) repeat protein
MLTEQAQAYSNLGQQRQAIDLLCGEATECQEGSALAIARQQSDSLGEAARLGSLGNIYRLQGEYEGALRSLRQSLAIAEKLQNSAYRIAAQNGLGNTYASIAKRDYRYAEFASETNDQTAKDKFTQQAKESDRKATQFFEAVVRVAGNNPTQESQALLNLATAYQRSELQPIEKTLQQAYNLRDRLPNSRDKVYGSIRLANLWQQSPNLDPNVQCSPQTPAQTIALLNQALSISQNIQDPQAEAFALVGHLPCL